MPCVGNKEKGRTVLSPEFCLRRLASSPGSFPHTFRFDVLRHHGHHRSAECEYSKGRKFVGVAVESRMKEVSGPGLVGASRRVTHVSQGTYRIVQYLDWL